MIIVVVLKRTNCRVKKNPSSLLGAGVLGHGLSSLRDSMLGQLSRKQKPHINKGQTFEAREKKETTNEINYE